MRKKIIEERIPSSFRDPSGFLFYENSIIYRQINSVYGDNYDHLINSGLYKYLTDSELLIPHEEVETHDVETSNVYKIIKPELIPFISYPYEWCFSQLKHAALLTLKIQRKSLEFGMSLKDCSAYNIQFRKGKPVFIDTLSFEKYRKNHPWVAYKQFCQHFIAPLTLMKYKDVRLSQLMKIHIDGIPLDLASFLLPFHTWFKFLTLIHIHLHAKSQKHYADKPVDKEKQKIKHQSFMALIDNLESKMEKIHWIPKDSEWKDYYSFTNYSSDAFNYKKTLVSELLDEINPKLVWDLGANIGLFSRIASKKRILTFSFDSDPAAVEKNYLECVKNHETNILPLLIDLTNPSASIGWQNNERMSLSDRGPADTVLALALIHHLAISNNLPFAQIAEFFMKICRSLIIEFVPKTDPQAQKLLATREDIFSAYTQENFENSFSRYFWLNKSTKIKNSARILYLMQKK